MLDLTNTKSATSLNYIKKVVEQADEIVDEFGTRYMVILVGDDSVNCTAINTLEFKTFALSEILEKNLKLCNTTEIAYI